MKKNDAMSGGYSEVISNAIHSLRKKNISASQANILNAMMLNMDAPEPHNLLGILSEMTGDDIKARKHYRAAYALDPTYKPACRNLERLVMFSWDSVSREFDYGDIRDIGSIKE
ncbi:MAG: tetratricopeptide repeat protein [Christensenellales bacterium]